MTIQISEGPVPSMTLMPTVDSRECDTVSQGDKGASGGEPSWCGQVVISISSFGFDMRSSVNRCPVGTMGSREGFLKERSLSVPSVPTRWAQGESAG